VRAHARPNRVDRRPLGARLAPHNSVKDARASGRRAQEIKMKKIYSICALLFCVCTIYSEEKIQNAALFIKPFEMYTSYIDKKYGVVFEAASAFNSYWGLKTETCFMLGQDELNSSLALGPQLNLTNTAMKGLLIGISPGIEINSYENKIKIDYKIEVEVSFNTIILDRFGIGFYAGYDIYQQEVRMGVKAGIFMHNDYYRK
jgi:hypothetical protein